MFQKMTIIYFLLVPVQNDKTSIVSASYNIIAKKSAVGLYQARWRYKKRKRRKRQPPKPAMVPGADTFSSNATLDKLR